VSATPNPVPHPESSAPSPSPADWIAGARPRTLPAAVVPVAVGAGAAAGAGVSFGDGVVWWRVAVALAVSLLLQIGVNYANDYSDGVRGTDDARVGPMRLVATGTASPGSVKRAAFVAFGLAALAGLALAAVTSWWLIAVGLAAIVAAWGYTGGPKPYGYLGLGELFVFVFFGLVATVGTTYVTLEDVPRVTWPAAVAVGLIACALLVVNNLRDIPTDAATGKRTLAVRLGDARTRWFYVGLVFGSFLLVVVCAVDRPWSLLGLVGLIPAAGPIRAVRDGATGPELVPVLVSTGTVQLVFGAGLTLGLAVG
jgi:1,4-dihydroxy-2-naphthoate octaprenyltransferase